MHPFVIVEVALGSLRDRAKLIEIASKLPKPPVASPAEVLDLITSATLGGSRIGYVDTPLLASTILMPRGWLWTRDKKLDAAARVLSISFA